MQQLELVPIEDNSTTCMTQKLSWPGSAQQALQPTQRSRGDQNMDPCEESLIQQEKKSILN